MRRQTNIRSVSDWFFQATQKQSATSAENQVPAPEKSSKKRKSTDDASEPATKKGKSTKKEEKKGVPSVEGIHLDGEEEDAAPVYETASGMRRAMTTFFKRPGVSQKAFAQAISDAAGFTVSTNSVANFRSKGKGKAGGAGAVDGADSKAFYAAWCYFEKLRILEGGKKSKHRLEMEKAWGAQGMSRDGLNKRVIMLAGQSVSYDLLGRMDIHH